MSKFEFVVRFCFLIFGLLAASAFSVFVALALSGCTTYPKQPKHDRIWKQRTWHGNTFPQGRVHTWMDSHGNIHHEFVPADEASGD